ncbi:MAG: tyrosine-type recombinase/integrase [Amphritea sp.]|nr:tyrosine-type recombinase/integrase [Amphritea sp.]
MIRRARPKAAVLPPPFLQQDTYVCKELAFLDPTTGKPWGGDHIIRKRVWTSALAKAGIKYRNPYQTRHTFASTMLSAGKNPLWVAQQTGHKDWGMIRKVYGRWITE